MPWLALPDPLDVCSCLISWVQLANKVDVIFALAQVRPWQRSTHSINTPLHVWASSRAPRAARAASGSHGGACWWPWGEGPRCRPLRPWKHPRCRRRTPDVALLPCAALCAAVAQAWCMSESDSDFEMLEKRLEALTPDETILVRCACFPLPRQLARREGAKPCRGGRLCAAAAPS